MPKVSVVMPVFNGERYLRAAIESILVQTFSKFEFIIIDDASTDSTADIIRSFSDGRILFLRNEHHAGITPALDKGVAAAKGEYICRMDADDIALPERLQLQVHFLDSHPDIAVLGSGVVLMDEEGNSIGRTIFPATPDAISRRIFIHNPFAHGTVMIRSTVLREMGGYDPRFLHNEDYDLWLRIAAYHPVANLEEALVMRRIHRGAVTVENETELARFRLKTLHHAIVSYYHKPLYCVYLLRPFLAYLYRRLI